MAGNRPPPLPDECPAVSYTVEVIHRSDYLTVEARLTHRMPDGALRPGMGSLNYPDPLRVSVSEPCRILRLLGDTTEARIERAKRRVARQAERKIARQRRLEDLMESYR